jgi:hypothetical protein
LLVNTGTGRVFAGSASKKYSLKLAKWIFCWETADGAPDSTLQARQNMIVVWTELGPPMVRGYIFGDI